MGVGGGGALWGCDRGINVANLVVALQAFVYPDEAGIAIGGPDTSSYIMIELHYNNPTLKAGMSLGSHGLAKLKD